LRDLVNATVGFEALAAAVDKPAKSLHRMLAPHGNPSTENFFDIVSALQKKTRVKLCVTAKAFGGSGAWADPDRQLAVALVLNSGIGTPFGDLRTVQIGGVALQYAPRTEKQR